MSKIINEQQYLSDNEVDLYELFGIIWSRKWLILIVCVTVGLLGLVFTLNLPNEYRSEALLAPSEESNSAGISALSGQLGGLASIAGVNLSDGGSNITIALEVLKSRAFIGEFIVDNSLKPAIMAPKGWDRGTNTLVFDESLYDDEKKKWVEDVGPLEDPEPSLQKVYNKFINEHLHINHDKETGFVKVAIAHYSPYLAKELVEKLITSLNNHMRENAVNEAQKSIDYLNLALSETEISGMRQVFYQLIEKQQQTKMLASVRDEYVFRTIDPAIIAEEKSSPKRALICVTLIISVFFITCLILIVKEQANRSRG